MVQLTTKKVPAPTADSVAWMHSGDLVLWFGSKMFRPIQLDKKGVAQQAPDT